MLSHQEIQLNLELPRFDICRQQIQYLTKPQFIPGVVRGIQRAAGHRLGRKSALYFAISCGSQTKHTFLEDNLAWIF